MEKDDTPTFLQRRWQLMMMMIKFQAIYFLFVQYVTQNVHTSKTTDGAGNGDGNCLHTHYCMHNNFNFLYTQNQGVSSARASLSLVGCRCTSTGMFQEKPTVLAGHLKHTDTMPFK